MRRADGDFRLRGFRELVEVLRFVQTALGWENVDLEVLIEWLEDLLKEGRAEWTVEDRAERFLECVEKTARFLFPHVVKVVDQERLPDGPPNQKQIAQAPVDYRNSIDLHPGNRA